jgi:hypothetical protein
MTSRRPIGEREAIRHAAAVVGKLRAYTLKELETVRAVPELLGTPTIGRGVPGLGVVVVRSLKSYKPSQPYEIAKNGKKNSRDDFRGIH